MNAKLLFVATIVSALATFASTVAMADEAPLTRAQVTAQLDHARANGTLQKTDYDFVSLDRAQVSTVTRAEVIAKLAVKPSPLLANSSDRSRTYNPFGTELLQPPTVTRAQVKAETLEAIASGTLPRSDYEEDQGVVARRANEHVAKPILARLFRANQTGS